MVAPLSASLFSPTSGTASKGGDPDDVARKEQARIKAEILSARSEKQCTTCEGDKKKLDQQIEQLETKLRQVETGSKAEPPRPKTEAADATAGDAAAGEGASSRGPRNTDDEGPAVLIDPATAERARAAGATSVAPSSEVAAPARPGATGTVGFSSSQPLGSAGASASGGGSYLPTRSPAAPPGLGLALDITA